MKVGVRVSLKGINLTSGESLRGRSYLRHVETFFAETTPHSLNLRIHEPSRRHE